MAVKYYPNVCLDTVTPAFHETGYIQIPIRAFSSQKDVSWHS